MPLSRSREISQDSRPSAALMLGTTCNSEPQVDVRLSIRIGIAEAALNQRDGLSI
jgi:hypothetical protein